MRKAEWEALPWTQKWSHHYCVHSTQNLDVPSPFQKVFMCGVSFALILAVTYMSKLYDTHLVMNINIVRILASSVIGRRKGGLGQSTCCI